MRTISSPSLDLAHQHQVRRHLVLDPGPDLVRVDERQRERAAASARCRAAARPRRRRRSVGRCGLACSERSWRRLWRCTARDVARDLAAVEDVADAAHRREPRAEHTVGEAALAVLVLGPFLLEQRHRLGRVARRPKLFDLERVLRAQALPLDLLHEVLAVPQLALDDACGPWRAAPRRAARRRRAPRPSAPRRAARRGRSCVHIPSAPQNSMSYVLWCGSSTTPRCRGSQVSMQ